ncbi:LysM peptidoglycan-binding domain-containing protein, partial [Salmonella enterica]|nr:LysM peptidoglycan-binding domain-containing protein [Salmonella enterica]
MKTHIYVLKTGETVTSVANSYGLSLVELKRINQFRKFSKPFETLSAGDELDVPDKKQKSSYESREELSLSSTKKNNINKAYNHFTISQPEMSEFQYRNMQESNDAVDKIRSLALGQLSGRTSQGVQAWLSQFGNARVQVGFNKDFSIENSSIDLLHPWMDKPKDILFTQSDLHRSDNRLQANLGIGWRHYLLGDITTNEWVKHPNNYMFGINSFLDYDTSRGNARWGVGGEYWRDFLKLSVNAYLRMTGWKDSIALEDYQERPANGWDFRVESYLPLYPQVGTKLSYEQYYGDEVGVMGAQERQKNPHAITFGVNYTPVPMITVGASRKIIPGGASDNSLNLTLNYHMGEPLSAQLDSDSVRTIRSLVGGRYDFVDRNNDIVLEYRKKTVIQISLPDELSGLSGQVITFPIVLLQDKYGLRDVHWYASRLIENGGGISGDGLHWSIKLPEFKSGGNNLYSLKAIAEDGRGNQSAPAEMIVKVIGNGVSRGNSELKIISGSEGGLIADGHSSQQVLLIVKDDKGNPLNGLSNKIKAKLLFEPLVVSSRLFVKMGRIQNEPALSDFVATGKLGEYVARLTAGVEQGMATISIEVLGQELRPLTIKINPISVIGAPADVAHSSLILTPSSLTLGGTATAKLVLKDTADKAVTGLTGLKLKVSVPAGAAAWPDEMLVESDTTPGT